MINGYILKELTKLAERDTLQSQVSKILVQRALENHTDATIYFDDEDQMIDTVAWLVHADVFVEVQEDTVIKVVWE